MRNHRNILAAGALAIAVLAVLLLLLNGRRTRYPLSITFVEWTDTFAPAPRVVEQAARTGLRLSTANGDWARLAITNHGTQPLRFDSSVVEYEAEGRWVAVSAQGWPGVHGEVWWPGTGSLASVPRPALVPAMARWRFHYFCALDPDSGIKKKLNGWARMLLKRDTLLFLSPVQMLSPEIPARQPNPETNQQPTAATLR